MPVDAAATGARRDTRLLALRALGAVTRLGERSADSSPPRRLLVMRPDHLGDLLFAGPALRRLRASLPEAEITVLTGPWGVPILEREHAIDSLLIWDIPWFNRRPSTRAAAPYLSALRLARVIRQRGFDTALVLRFDFWWGALAAALAGVPRRLGYAIPEVSPFINQSVPYVVPGARADQASRHEVERNLTLVGALTGDNRPPSWDDRLSFQPTEVERASLDRLLADRGIPGGDSVIAIHSGAGATLKLWTTAGFAAVADSLAAQTGARIVLTGSESERVLARSITDLASCRPVGLAGETTLGMLAALFQRSRLVIGADSGPLHVAVAAGAPTVHIYGPVNHRLFGPWGDPRRHAVVRLDLECSPCGRLDRCTLPDASRRCLVALTPDRVIAAAERVLREVTTA